MFKDNKNFYPTPQNLIDKMLTGIDFKMINTVLEPSAGKGDIVKSIVSKFEYSHSYGYNRDKLWDIDCIEINENLRYILQGKKYRVIHDDFLTFDTLKRYDLIVMNPPFDDGEKHLLKALDMQKKGGQVVCLLNAETLKNPFSNTRKDLVMQLEKYNAEIQYISNGFLDAERQTDVDIALIKVDIEKPQETSIILDELKKQEQYKTKSRNNKQLIDSDFINGIVQQYQFEVKAGLKLIDEYNALQPLMLSSVKKDDSSNNILELVLYRKDDDHSSLDNSYIKQIRMKYWKALFMSDQFMGLFTSNLRERYVNKINELRNYDFSLYNIYTIKIQLNNNMIKAVEDTILKLFDKFSYQSSWDKEFSKNIHYYNGWATNSCWKINNKIIQRMDGYDSYDKRFYPTSYRIFEELCDIEKTFTYLAGDSKIQDIDLSDALHYAESIEKTKNINTKYMTLDFFKKGTVHIKFKYPELVHKLNVFGSQRKGWLPPSYGKSTYRDMTKEEKEVIDEFEGKESYDKVMANTDYYIMETSKILMLA